MKNKLVFVDAETDGLYGQFLTVALLATDMEGKEIDRAYYGIQREKMRVSDVWAIEHVLPVLGKYQSCENEKDLFEKVWKFWTKYSEEAYAVADVMYPVECRLFERCVLVDKQKRKWMAPFPLLDLSSILFARGIDPLTERSTILKKMPTGIAHNALFDVEVSAAVWRQYVG